MRKTAINNNFMLSIGNDNLVPIDKKLSQYFSVAAYYIEEPTIDDDDFIIKMHETNKRDSLEVVRLMRDLDVFFIGVHEGGILNPMGLKINCQYMSSQYTPRTWADKSSAHELIVRLKIITPLQSSSDA